jgi:quinol-cytochrome oxidoreductase complex cytochrome b subunit
MKALKRMFIVTIFMVNFMIMGLAIFLPFSDPLWFIGSFVVILLEYGYGMPLLEWLIKLDKE